MLVCVAEELQGQLAAEQEGRRRVSRDLAGAQKYMEQMRATIEAQSAELTSVKVSTYFFEHESQTSCVACFP